MKRRIIGPAAAVLLILLLLGNGLFFLSPTEVVPEVKYLVGMSQGNLIDPWNIAMQKAVEQEARAHSELRVIFTDAANSVQRQQEDIDRLLDYGIDLLILSPQDGQAMTELLKEVYAQIPVIVLSPGVFGEDYTMSIMPDHYAVGQMQGLLLQELLPSGGTILELADTAVSPAARQRQQGLYEAILQGKQNLEIVQTVTAKWTQDSAEDKLKEFLVQQQPQLDAIVAQTDSMAQGAALACEKMRSLTGIPIVGAGGATGNAGGLQAVHDGVLAGTILCPTGGTEAVSYALRILKQEPNLPREVILPCEPFPDNRTSAANR